MDKIFDITYQLEEEWELVPGNWRFQLFFDGNIIADMTFKLYKP